MSTEAILMADIKGLGSEGDVVNVADGYARNYLFPRKLGAPVTDATRRRLASMQKEREATVKARLDEAQAAAAKLANVSCTIPVKVGPEDKMYGSVGASDIIEMLKTQGVDLDRHSLVLDDPIKELGVYDVKVRLHKDVETAVKVWVVEE